jgi:DNA-binding MarR family transcriptional regulator
MSAKKSAAASIDAMAMECVAMRLRLLNRVVTRLYDDALRPLGLKASQLNILVAAWKLGVANPAQVCQVLDLDPSTLSRNVDRMRNKGWLEVVHGQDAREEPFRLTAAGRRLLEKAASPWNLAQEETKRLLGDRAVRMLGETVDHVRQRDSSV